MTEAEVTKCYNEHYAKYFAVKSILEDNFGADNVDFFIPLLAQDIEANKDSEEYHASGASRYSAVVHFPEVEITNENDDHTTIYDLWVKITVGVNGTLQSFFSMKVTTLQRSHALADYGHSHLEGIPFEDPQYWQSPCLGNGPIRDTQTSLISDFDADVWNLFCFELGIYVRTESLEGIPWRRLDQITKSDWFRDTIPLNYNPFELPRIQHLFMFGEDGNTMMLDFLHDALMKIESNCEFSDSNGTSMLAMSQLDFLYMLSDMFIEWFNASSYRNDDLYNSIEKLTESHILYWASRGTTSFNISTLRRTHPDSEISNDAVDDLDGQRALRFKGRDVYYRITEDVETRVDISQPENARLVINWQFAEALHKMCNIYINCLFSNNTLTNDILQSHFDCFRGTVIYCL